MSRSLIAHGRRFGVSLLLALSVCGAQAAVYNFKVVSAARKATPIITAGSYIFVEVLQDPGVANTVLFRFTSRIPQPVASIVGISFDTGADKGLFTSMTVRQQLVAKMAATPPTATSLYGEFNPVFAFAPNENSGKLYDPTALQPGGMVTIAAALAPAVVRTRHQCIEPGNQF